MTNHNIIELCPDCGEPIVQVDLRPRCLDLDHDDTDDPAFHDFDSQSMSSEELLAAYRAFMTLMVHGSHATRRRLTRRERRKRREKRIGKR